MLIRPAQDEDVPELLAIYRPYVEGTTVSFEEDPPSPEEFAKRVGKYAESHAWLVAVADGRIAGYAYGSPHRERAAYRFSTETSVYVASVAQRTGVGRALYEALMPRLADKGYCNAYAGVALPNAASVALHEAVGFRQVGVFPRVGHKFGRWHDVLWLHRALREEP